MKLMGHWKRYDASGIAGLLFICGLFMGLYIGDRVNDGAHRTAAEQKIMQAQVARDMPQYRAENDVEAKAHAAKSARAYIRRVR